MLNDYFHSSLIGFGQGNLSLSEFASDTDTRDGYGRDRPVMVLPRIYGLTPTVTNIFKN